MTTIVVDAALRSKLVAAGRVAEFRDEAGELIGRFIPAGYSGDEPDLGISDAELQRRLAPDCKTYSTAEVLAHLRGLK
jgi:hypothetical protein